MRNTRKPYKQRDAARVHTFQYATKDKKNLQHKQPVRFSLSLSQC